MRRWNSWVRFKTGAHGVVLGRVAPRDAIMVHLRSLAATLRSYAMLAPIAVIAATVVAGTPGAVQMCAQHNIC